MSIEEDMALTPISESTSLQAEIATAPAAAVMEPIELSFSAGPGGAWDDRELIKASDAAMKEFHVHHPGPGSWLDKATAALAQGRPLPGANAFDTAWYTASIPETETTPTEPAPPAKRAKTLPKQAKHTNGTNGTPIVNPYASTSTQPAVANGSASRHSRAGARGSPTYAPASPQLGVQLPRGAGVDVEADGGDEDGEGDGYDEDAEWEMEDYVYSQAAPGFPPAPAPASAPAQAHAGPSIGVQPTGISRDDALGYAMTAQYWAGYWMGVAQSQAQSTGAGSQSVGADAGESNGEAVGTRQSQANGRSTLNGLRR